MRLLLAAAHRCWCNPGDPAAGNDVAYLAESMPAGSI